MGTLTVGAGVPRQGVPDRWVRRWRRLVESTRPATGPGVVYLTFDDGPHPQFTPSVLDVLARHGARATFFLVGSRAQEHPDLVARIRAAGHGIGGHGFSHRRMTGWSAAELLDELRATDAVLGPTRVFRPPFGELDPAGWDVVTAAGKSVELWDVDPRDWASPGADVIVGEVLRGTRRPGRVVLLHDGGVESPAQTVAALEQILPTLVARGAVFEPLPGV